VKLKQVVKMLNRQHIDNDFKLTELAAKRSADKNRDAVVVRFVNQYPWKDFTPGRVVLYEALPVGWPLSNMAERLNCSIDELRIISHYNSLTRKWRDTCPADELRRYAI